MAKGRTPIKSTETPDIRINETALERADAAAGELAALQDQAMDEARDLATQLGYEGSLTLGSLEDEIRFYQRRTVEALLETGKRLLLMKKLAPHGQFEQRVQLLGFSWRTANRFMQAAEKTSKFANLANLSTQVKNASAFLELVTHDEDDLKIFAEMDAIDRMSATELREALRQAKEDNSFTGEQLEKERIRADKAEKRLRGKVPEVLPLDERITPFQVEITERQSLMEKGITAHLEAVAALDAWWTDDVTSRPDYDPEESVQMPKPVGLVLMHLVGSANRLASMVGQLQHALEERFGMDIAQASQYLMQEPAAAGSAND